MPGLLKFFFIFLVWNEDDFEDLENFTICFHKKNSAEIFY